MTLHFRVFMYKWSYFRWRKLSAVWLCCNSTNYT